MVKAPNTTEQSAPAASGAPAASETAKQNTPAAPAASATPKDTADDMDKKIADMEARLKDAEEKAAAFEKKASDAEARAEEEAEARKKTEVEAAEKLAEALEKDNADTDSIPEISGDVAYVFANLQTGQKFTLPDGTVVTIDGMSVSSLKKPGGGFFVGGKYGVTPIPADQWAQIMKIYGKMKIFQSGLVFAASSMERGKAMARERGGLRHGYEPVDPNSDRAKTTPKTEE